MAVSGPLPVFLLTGFLGSGKTTLLSQLVRSPAFSDTAVIINEFGEIGLDHLLVGKSDDQDVMLLDSGCLCCVSSSAIQDTLETLYYRRLRGEIPPFARVVVETSGLADPGPIINTLASDPLVARHFRFSGTVTVVDAVHGLATLEQYREAAVQAAVADRIALTKTDLADADAIASVKAALQQHNPTAPVLHAGLRQAEASGEAALAVSGMTGSPVAENTLSAAFTSDAADTLRAATASTSGSAASVAAALFDGLCPGHLPDATSLAAATGSPSVLGHVLRYGIVSYVWRQSDPIGWEDYARWVRYLQRTLGEHLLRVKGILQWDDGVPRTVHGVRLLFSHPEPLDAAAPSGKTGAVVLIVRDLSAEDIQLAMAQLQG